MSRLYTKLVNNDLTFSTHINFVLTSRCHNKYWARTVNIETMSKDTETEENADVLYPKVAMVSTQCHKARVVNIPFRKNLCQPFCMHVRREMFALYVYLVTVLYVSGV